MHSERPTLEHSVREEDDASNHPAWLQNANVQIACTIFNVGNACDLNLLIGWWLRLLRLGFAGHDLLLLLLNLIESVLKFDLLLVHFNELV